MRVDVHARRIELVGERGQIFEPHLKHSHLLLETRPVACVSSAYTHGIRHICIGTDRHHTRSTQPTLMCRNIEPSDTAGRLIFKSAARRPTVFY